MEIDEILNELRAIRDYMDERDAVCGLGQIVELINSIEMSKANSLDKVDPKLSSFIQFLKEEKFELKTDNPGFRPGEGYGPPRYINWTIDRVLSDFLKENEPPHKCPFCSATMKGIELTHYKCKNCNEYFTN